MFVSFVSLAGIAKINATSLACAQVLDTLDDLFDEQETKIKMLDGKLDSLAHSMSLVMCANEAILEKLGLPTARELTKRERKRRDSVRMTFQSKVHKVKAFKKVMAKEEEIYFIPEKDRTVLQLRAYHLTGVDCSGTSDPYVRLCRVAEGRDIEKIEGHKLLWESEVAKRDLDPIWHSATIEIRPDDESELVLQVWDYDRRGEHDLLGVMRTTMNDLRASLGVERPLIKHELIDNPGYLNSGCIKVLHCAAKGEIMKGEHPSQDHLKTQSELSKMEDEVASERLYEHHLSKGH